MKKYLAVFVAVLLLVCAGSAFAADGDSGHVTPAPNVQPKEVSNTVSNVTVVNTDLQTNVTQDAVRTDVPAAIKSQVESKASDIAGRLGVSGSTTVINNSSNTPLATTFTPAQVAARMQEKSGGTRQAIGSVASFGATQSGLMSLVLSIAREFFGKAIQLDMGARGKVSGSSVASAAANDDAVFMNSKGDIVTVVPDGSNGENPGEITAVVAVVAGEEYDPIISVPTLSAAEQAEMTTTETSVTYEETTYETETPSRDPGSSGGGCSAGFSALALAVLGGFIAARKK